MIHIYIFEVTTDFIYFSEINFLACHVLVLC